MTRRLRQLVVPAILTVALATGAMAQSDSVVVVMYGPDGLMLSAPGDVPVGDAPTALLRVTESNGWAIKTLSPGDIPSEEVVSFPQYVHVPNGIRFDRARSASTFAERPAMNRLRSRLARPSNEVVDVFEIDTQRSVLFEITATLGQLEMDDALVTALSENEALRRLEVADADGSHAGHLEARFTFDSVEAWQAWKAAPETVRLLDALRDAVGEMRTRMDVRQ